jgi:hypothetical protein
MTGISSRRTSKIIISPGFMSANPIGAPSERIERRIFRFFACRAVLLHLLDGGNREVAETLANCGFGKEIFLPPNMQARQQ